VYLFITDGVLTQVPANTLIIITQVVFVSSEYNTEGVMSNTGDLEKKRIALVGIGSPGQPARSIVTIPTALSRLLVQII
jgi:hypothetical protein